MLPTQALRREPALLLLLSQPGARGGGEVLGAFQPDAQLVATLDAIETRYAQRGKSVEIIGLNDPSADLHGKLTGELTGSH